MHSEITGKKARLRDPQQRGKASKHVHFGLRTGVMQLVKKHHKRQHRHVIYSLFILANFYSTLVN